MSFWTPINYQQLLFNINQKVCEVKQADQRNIPVIFVLIGSYPGASQIHQTPPVIKKYLENEYIYPIVILIDGYYASIHTEEKNNTLNFMTSDNTKPNPYQWYYPDTLMPLNIKCHNRVAYQYYPNIIDESELQILVRTDVIKDNLTHVWCFEGRLFIENTNMLCSPASSCMANVDSEIEYFPVITFNSETNSYMFKPMFNSIDEVINEINTDTDNDKKMLSGFLYNMLEKWCNEFSTYRKWEIFIRLKDPSRKCELGRESTISDWTHLYYRANIKIARINASNIIHKKFLKSEHHTFKQFLDDNIYKMGITLINLGSRQKASSYDIQRVYDSFNEEMSLENNTVLPSLFSDILHHRSNIFKID